MDRRAAQQGERTLDVAPLDVGEAARDLGKALPQHPLVVRAVLPCGLKPLVRTECQAPVQQVLSVGEGFGRRQPQIIRDRRNALSAARKWPPESVARARASGPPGFVAITLGHLPIMASRLGSPCSATAVSEVP